jgi:hypothetical protein
MEKSKKRIKWKIKKKGIRMKVLFPFKYSIFQLICFFLVR